MMNQTTLRGRRAARLVGVGGSVLLAALAVGCADGSRAVDAADDRNQSDVAKATNNESAMSSMLDGLMRRDHIPAEVVESFVELAHQPGWERSLRVSDLSEAEFVSIPQEQRNELYERLLKQFGRLRGLASATLDRAEALRDQGDADRAQRYIESVRRAGQANTSGDLIKLSQMVGESLLEQAAEFDRGDRG